MTSYYDVLGVGVDADLEEVRRAYYRKARLLHPDRYAGSSDPERRQAGAEMTAVNEAWGTLRNPGTRRRYDIELGLIDIDAENEELRDECLWDEVGPQPGRSAVRRERVPLAVALALLVGVFASLIAVVSQPDDQSTRWSASAIAQLRSSALNAGMTAPQANCFVEVVTGRYRPSDNIEWAAIQQVADACR